MNFAVLILFAEKIGYYYFTSCALYYRKTNKRMKLYRIDSKFLLCVRERMAAKSYSLFLEFDSNSPKLSKIGPKGFIPTMEVEERMY